MIELHAQIDLVEGTLAAPLSANLEERSKRAFVLLTLMRNDGTVGVGEASPLPGYSPDRMDDVLPELRALADAPIVVDALESPKVILQQAFSRHDVQQPSSRFALEAALLDWLGRSRGVPVHRLLAVESPQAGIPIADLMPSESPSTWPERADSLVAGGATHVKLKVGADLDGEVPALETIRQSHPRLGIRLDGNRRIAVEALRRHATRLEALALDLFEEPVAVAEWPHALGLPLPLALDESLRDRSLAEPLLDSGRIRAVVLKPTVLGGLAASLELAELAAARGAEPVVSHTFDGPVARAASAELALVLGGDRAAGLGVHPALDLWPPHRIAAIEGRRIEPHDAPGLGLDFPGDPDA